MISNGSWSGACRRAARPKTCSGGSPAFRSIIRAGHGARRSWLRWFSGDGAPWTAGLAGAFASLAVGFWLGFSGLVDSTTIVDTASSSSDDDVVALVFPSVPTSIGDYQ